MLPVGVKFPFMTPSILQRSGLQRQSSYPQARLGCPVHRLALADCSSAHCLRQPLQVTAAGRRSKCCGCSVCMQEWRQPLSLGAEREPFNRAERETRCVCVLERGVLGNGAVRALKNNNIISDYFCSKTETEHT